MDNLLARFRDHTVSLFAKHGIELVGFWVPDEGQEGHGNTLVYLLSFADREDAKKRWAAFGADPEWERVRTESEQGGGRLAEGVESSFLTPTDFSPLS